MTTLPAAAIGRYLGLLRQPDFRRLWLAQSISQDAAGINKLVDRVLELAHTD